VVGVPSVLGVAGSPSNTKSPGEAYLHTKCHLSPFIQSFGHYGHWTKIGGGLCPFRGGVGNTDR